MDEMFVNEEGEGDFIPAYENDELPNENLQAPAEIGTKKKTRDKYKDQRPDRPRKALGLFEIDERLLIADNFPRLPKVKRFDKNEDLLVPPKTWSSFDISPEALNRSLHAIVGRIEDDSYLKKHITSYVTQETIKLIYQGAFLDISEARNIQIVKLKASLSEEDINTKLMDWFTFVGVKNSAETDQLQAKSKAGYHKARAVACSRQRRECDELDKEVGKVRRRAEKKMRDKVAKLGSDLKVILQESGFDTTGLNVLGYDRGKTKRKNWTDEEERRLRSGFYFFGRDFHSIQKYLKLERLGFNLTSNSNQMAKLKSKVQKLFCVWRKCALPLPEAVRAQAREYTMGGVYALRVRSNIWTETHKKIQEMMDMNDVPFGRRRFIIPCYPLFVNLIDDELSDTQLASLESQQN